MRMDTRHQEFRVGIMVLACIVSLVLMAVFFGRRPMMNFGGEDAAIQIRFQRAPGITPGSPVFKSGVQIGRVSRVELVEHDRQVQVSIVLSRGRKIYTDEDVRIMQRAIMGDAYLEFIKRLNFTGRVEELDPRSVPYLIGIDSVDLMGGFANIESDLTRAIQNVAETADHLGTFIGRLNTVIGTPEELRAFQENFATVIDETRQTMLSVRQSADGINRFVNDPDVQTNVRKAIADLPRVIDQAGELVGEATHFVQDARLLVEKGHDSLDSLGTGIENVMRTLNAFSAIADQVEGDVPEIVSAVRRSAQRLEMLFTELVIIVENFRHADGTVKRLIRDPEAYEKLLATLDNVERITEEVEWMLRVDVRPISHNVKVLTDKAARDPAVFIRNLLRPEPPIKPMACCLGVGPQFPALVRSGVHFPPSTQFPALRGGQLPTLRVPPVPALVRSEVQFSTPPVRIEHIPQPSGGRIVNVDPRYMGF